MDNPELLLSLLGRDQTHHPHHSTSINATIIEKRAPTDESMRLLQEMEEKVRGQIVQSFVVNDNLVTGAVLVMSRHPFNLETHIYVAFKLNGRHFETTVVEKQGFRLSMEEAGQRVREAVAQKVTSLLFDAGAQAGTLIDPRGQP